VHIVKGAIVLLSAKIKYISAMHTKYRLKTHKVRRITSPTYFTDILSFQPIFGAGLSEDTQI
jgi:hypothetical protein